MTVAALVLTAITAVAALWTVRLAYKAIRIAKESAVEGTRAANAAARTAQEVFRARAHVELRARRLLLYELHQKVVEMQGLQRSSPTNEPTTPPWLARTSRLRALLVGHESELPATSDLTLATNLRTARANDSRLELERALLDVEEQKGLVDVAEDP